MIRSDHQALRATNGLVLLGACLIPLVVFPQANRAELEQRELDITRQIEAQSIASGPRAESLIDLLSQLSVVYEQMGDRVLADATTEQMLDLVRTNHGLYSLEQLPGIRRLMALREGEAWTESVWELEQQLLDLADRHPNDVRSASILTDVAHRRLEILRGYESGEYQPEIELGCYYQGSFYKPDASLRGSRPMYSADLDSLRHGCSAGSSLHVKLALLQEAQTMYSAAAAIGLRQQGFPATELRSLLADIILISYRMGNYGTGLHTYGVLLDYETDAGSSPLTHAESLVQSADWNILYSPDLGTTLIDDALSDYRQAWESLRQHNVPQESIDAIFNPQIPVALPSFITSPLESSEAGSTGYIDVAFNITSRGRSDDIEIVGASENVRRADMRDLEQLIGRTLFRPIMADGEMVDLAPVSLRYYLSR